MGDPCGTFAVETAGPDSFAAAGGLAEVTGDGLLLEDVLLAAEDPVAAGFM